MQFLIHFILTLSVLLVPSELQKNRKATTLHAFHTSLTEIQYNAREKSLEVTIRMFTDDLESALTKLNNGQKVMIGGKNDNSDALLSKYVQQHFAIISPQKQKKAMQYLGKEPEGDATWVYIEIPEGQTLKDHTIYNDLMQELFDDQTNLINLFYGSNKKTFLFNSKIKSAAIEF
ncbi:MULTISPECIES: DUF6702 family protein [Emticicia]|uniref:DUF6702 family protein n=1 Tax=Emticicia TaxID=312278 RepID=UPI0020A0974D|nr:MULTISPECIES: DUF6702 family protein [Emticicia]UTA67640.1 hypothetical protein MB380_18870 [Emticicia sp. 21SJ11W-3]